MKTSRFPVGLQPRRLVFSHHSIRTNLGAPSIERLFARWVGDHKGQPLAIPFLVSFKDTSLLVSQSPQKSSQGFNPREMFISDSAPIKRCSAAYSAAEGRLPFHNPRERPRTSFDRLSAKISDRQPQPSSFSHRRPCTNQKSLRTTSAFFDTYRLLVV
jgi:hypothetical protein